MLKNKRSAKRKPCKYGAFPLNTYDSICNIITQKIEKIISLNKCCKNKGFELD